MDTFYNLFRDYNDFITNIGSVLDNLFYAAENFNMGNVVKNQYDIHFIVGDNPVMKHKIKYGERIGYMPQLVKDGCAFAGWYTYPDDRGVEITSDTIYLHEADLNLYARFVYCIEEKKEEEYV